ncbi:MAG: PorP/SprF family type IX secretion system membrane protein [Saprospiraceae bacterium]
MKQIISIFLIIGIATTTAFSQQIPLYTQYNINGFTINPAYAGSKDIYEIRSSYRTQWTDFPTAPKTYVASATTGFKRAGFGILAFNDESGSISRTGFLGAYAYHIPLFLDYKMSIGISMKYLQYRLSSKDIEDKLTLDNAIISAVNGRGRFDGTLGFYFYNKNLYFGLSAPNLIQTKFEEDGVSGSQLSDVTRHYFGLLGYDLEWNGINIEPSILVRQVQAAPFQLEMNLKIWFLDKQMMIGSSYRTSEKTVVGLLGFAMDSFRFFYSYDLSYNNLANYHGGSHEFTIGFDIKKSNKKNGVKIKKR